MLQLTLVLPGCAGLAVLQRCRRRQQVLEPQLVSCTLLLARRCETTHCASRQRLQTRHALPPPVPSSRAVTCARVNVGCAGLVVVGVAGFNLQSFLLPQLVFALAERRHWLAHYS